MTARKRQSPRYFFKTSLHWKLYQHHCELNILFVADLIIVWNLTILCSRTAGSQDPDLLRKVERLLLEGKRQDAFNLALGQSCAQMNIKIS